MSAGPAESPQAENVPPVWESGRKLWGVGTVPPGTPQTPGDLCREGYEHWTSLPHSHVLLSLTCLNPNYSLKYP